MYYGAFNEGEGGSGVLAELVVVTHAACGCSGVVVRQLLESSMRELWASSSGNFNTKILTGSHSHIP